MTEITLNKGGAAERVIDSSEISVPDLWHLAQRLKDNGDHFSGNQILECWHLAHNLKAHIQRQDQ